MRIAKKLTIKRWVNDKLVESREKIICAYCESTQVYKVRNKEEIYCRACGKLSKLKEKKK